MSHGLKRIYKSKLVRLDADLHRNFSDYSLLKQIKLIQPKIPKIAILATKH
jgi:hypothetical protein